MPSTPEISVVCAWYNRAEHVSDTLDSLSAQTLQNIEIVVVNDGSPDQRVREALDACTDPRLRVIHQENTGFTVAISNAIRAARAPLIAIQGAGDISLPQRIETQKRLLDENPDCAIAGCHYVERSLVSGVSRVIECKPPRRDALGFPFSHGELMYRRDVYESVGGYRPFFTYGQGSDLWMRMLRAHRAIVAGEVLYEQRLFADGVALSAEKQLIRAALSGFRHDSELFYRKHGIDLIDVFGNAAPMLLPKRDRTLRAVRRALAALELDGKAMPGVLDRAALRRLGVWTEKVALGVQRWRKRKR